MGGTGQAMETADVALMSDDLGRLLYAFRISRAAMKTIKTNVIFALGVKLVFFMIVLLGFGTMWMAVFADVGTTLLVTLYGMRLLRMENP
jgi:Zn2+/Cd2+-exporting ATPase